MESEARYVRVGLITLALAALLIGGLYWLSGRTGAQDLDYYTVYFAKQSLEGLQINSDVRMQGIKVGKVADYNILPGEAHKVRVKLQVDARTPVLEGVTAVVSRQLVTGLAAIDLDTPPDARTPLTKVPPGEKYPVIPEGVSQFAMVADSLQNLNQDLQASLNRFNALLSDSNQRAFTHTLNNLDSITGDIRKTMPEIQASVSSLHQAADQVNGLGADARVTLKQTTADLDRLTGEAGGTLVAVRSSLDRIDNEIGDMSSRIKLTSDLAGQQVESTAQSLNQAGNALQDTGRALSDPARALFGPSPYDLGPGEEIKK